MRHFFAVLVVGTVGFQWVLLGSWALDHDLTLYRSTWSAERASVAAAPAVDHRSVGMSLAGTAP